MSKKYKILLWLMPVLMILGWIVFNWSYQNTETLHIAFIGPLSGTGASAGKSMTQAIQWYLDQANQNGGIQGKKIVLDLFDDQNKASLAREKALEVVHQNQALAVIGHWYSSASISASEIYKQHHIPAITPGSTNVKVTINNDWYFRNIFNANSSGQFLANYVKKVLKQETITIIHEEAAYGAYLAQVVENTFCNLGEQVKYRWSYDNEDPNLDQTLTNIVDQLKAKKDEAGMIFLAVQAIEGIKLVKRIKEAGLTNGIIGSTSFSEKTFRHGFTDFPLEKDSPGFYTEGIYVATPLIFDTANEKAFQFKEAYQNHYKEESDWAAAYAADTALVIVEALKKAGIQGQPETLTKDRQKIRDYLADLNQLEKAIEGVTGFNYFDRNGDAPKPVSIGVYRNNNIISALTQLQVIRDVDEIDDLEAARQEERILLIDDKYMYQTNVVYTGIKINEISEINFQSLTYTFDFNLWFRFQGDIKPQHIEFINAVEPIQPEMLADDTIQQMNYQLYRIKGRFKADFLASHHTFKQHILGVSFRHRQLSRNNLIYVTDVLGMSLTQKSPMEKQQPSQLSHDLLNWDVYNISFFQDIATEISLGNPKYINVPGGVINYSRFNAAILIKPHEFALSHLIPSRWIDDLTIISIVALVFLALSYKYFQQGQLYRVILGLKVIFAFLLLLFTEIILLDWLLFKQVSFANLQFVIIVFEILWWILPAILLNVAIEQFIWRPLEIRTERKVPNLIRSLLSIMIYIMAFFGILAFVFNQQMTSLLATSGVIAMIIGLAIQVNISNIFSGIAINLERPFRVGDWIQIGPFDEGIVVNINWRTTQIHTRNNCILNIPNSTASESTIHNFSYPNKIVEEWISVHVNSLYSPEYIESILLQAVLSAESVLSEPKPFTRLRNINKWSAEYSVNYYIQDYAKKNVIRRAVWKQVWTNFNQANIPFAVQRHNVFTFQGLPKNWPRIDLKSSYEK